MIKGIFYLFSFLILWIAIMLYKKHEEKCNFLVWLFCSAFFVLTVQAFFAGLMSVVHIPIGDIGIGMTNCITAGVLGFFVKKKGIQKYYVKIVDILVVVTILLMIIKFVEFRYGKDMYINFISVDASAHYTSAKCVALEHVLPHNMYFAALSTGLVMEAMQSFGWETFYLYQIFVFCEIVYTAFSAYLFWAVIRENSENKFLTMLGALPLTVFYWMTYPVYSTMFGFSYFGVVVSLITLLLFVVNGYLVKEYDKWFIIVALNLNLFAVFVCYTLFVPTVFVGTFIAIFIKMIKDACISEEIEKDEGVVEKEESEAVNGFKNIKLKFAKIYKNITRFKIKKLVSIKNILTMLYIFLIPTILGLVKSFANVKELSPATSASGSAGIATDGGCYTDYYSNFIILIPFALIGIGLVVNKRRSLYIIPILVVQLAFMILLFNKAMDGQVSAYYYMKNNNVMWVLVMVLVAEAIFIMMEKHKGAFIFTLYFIGLLYMARYGDYWVNERNPRFLSSWTCYFVDIAYFNDGFYYEHTWITDDEIDLYNYVYENCTDAETIGVNEEMENSWFSALTGNWRVFTYGGIDEFMAKQDENVGYICIVYSDPYWACVDYFDSLDVVYFNASGRIVKVGN